LHHPPASLTTTLHRVCRSNEEWWCLLRALVFEQLLFVIIVRAETNPARRKLLHRPLKHHHGRLKLRPSHRQFFG
jgi:hypothetical protein